MENKNTLAVLISDIHFTINTLDVASKALKSALSKAQELKVPLVIAGDLHDSKAIIRAEIANRIIEILSSKGHTPVLILVGNHDLINEKGQEHSLNYLRPYAYIIDKPIGLSFTDTKSVQLIPYQSDYSIIPELIKDNKYTDLVIMHQGVQGAYMGEYIQDKTSVSPEIFKDKKVYSGHYHRYQSIGNVTYIGNPYTLTFGESNDPAKGYLILNDDGNHVHVPLNLRTHYIVERAIDELNQAFSTSSEDIVWLKVRGLKSELFKVNKKDLGLKVMGRTDYKLELIPIDSEPQHIEVDSKSHNEILDSLIDNLSESDIIKQELKHVWRDLIK